MSEREVNATLAEWVGGDPKPISFTLRPVEDEFPQFARVFKIRLGCWDYVLTGLPTLVTTQLPDGTTRASVTLRPQSKPTRIKWRFGKGWRRHVRREKAAKRLSRG